jgi:hypothetical protein
MTTGRINQVADEKSCSHAFRCASPACVPLRRGPRQCPAPRRSLLSLAAAAAALPTGYAHTSHARSMRTEPSAARAPAAPPLHAGSGRRRVLAAPAGCCCDGGAVAGRRRMPAPRVQHPPRALTPSTCARQHAPARVRCRFRAPGAAAPTAGAPSKILEKSPSPCRSFA